VFVVAHLGKGNLAAKVLFESESVRRDTPPSREARKGIASNVAPSLTASNDPSRSPQSSEVTQQVNAVLEAINAGIPDVCATIDCGLSKQVGKQLTQQAESFYFPIPIHDQATRHSGKHGDKQDGKGNGLGVGKPGDPAPTLTKGDKHAVLYENHPNDSRVTGPHDVAPSCVSRYGTNGGNVPLVQPQDLMAVRRLTPRECERLQGFNDDHTMIPWRNKPADECPDGPRYKALGNSMAVPCMAWIGKRIDAVEKAK
jgi:DNA (cytosine-5)-methyltransferase 1